MRTVGVLALTLGLLLLGRPAGAGHAWTPPLLTIDAASLQRLTAAGRAVLAIDVRSEDAFASGRLPGARSIPLSSLTVRQREVPLDTLTILYGADGVEEATVAYRYLRAAGHTNVFVLEGGFAGWRAQGYGVEK